MLRVWYGVYEGEMRAEIAKWVLLNGCRPASSKYGIAESTIRGFIKSYKASQSTDGRDIDSVEEDISSHPMK